MDTSSSLFDDFWQPSPPINSHLLPSCDSPHLFPSSLPPFDLQEPHHVLPSFEELLPNQSCCWQPKCELQFSHSLPPLEPLMVQQSSLQHSHLNDIKETHYSEPKYEQPFSHLPSLLSSLQSGPKPSRSHTLRGGINRSYSGVNTHSQSLHGNSERTIKKGSLSHKEAHIHSERQRRQGMSGLFTTLKSLLPPAQVKSDRCTILTYVIEYVHSLKESLHCLSKIKAELLSSRQFCIKAPPDLFREAGKVLSRSDSTYDLKWEETGSELHLQQQASSSFPLPIDVTVRFWSSADVFITLNCPKKKGLWPELLSILETQNVAVENVTLSTTGYSCFHCIYAKVPDVCAISCDSLRAVLVDFMVTQLRSDFHGSTSDFPTW